MLRKAQFVVLMALVLASVYMLLSQATVVEEQAKITAFQLAVAQMNARAVRVKQIWILHNKPSELEFEGRVMRLNERGWPRLEKATTSACRDLLIFLYPKITILEFSPTIERKPVKQGYQCLYIYNDINQVQISLDQHGLSITLTE